MPIEVKHPKPRNKNDLLIQTQKSKESNISFKFNPSVKSPIFSPFKRQNLEGIQIVKDINNPHSALPRTNIGLGDKDKINHNHFYNCKFVFGNNGAESPGRQPSTNLNKSEKNDSPAGMTSKNLLKQFSLQLHKVKKSSVTNEANLKIKQHDSKFSEQTSGQKDEKAESESIMSNIHQRKEHMMHNKNPFKLDTTSSKAYPQTNQYYKSFSPSIIFTNKNLYPQPI